MIIEPKVEIDNIETIPLGQEDGPLSPTFTILLRVIHDVVELDRRLAAVEDRLNTPQVPSGGRPAPEVPDTGDPLPTAPSTGDPLPPPPIVTSKPVSDTDSTGVPEGLEISNVYKAE